jgi:hypothetical protein
LVKRSGARCPLALHELIGERRPHVDARADEHAHVGHLASRERIPQGRLGVELTPPCASNDKGTRGQPAAPAAQPARAACLSCTRGDSCSCGMTLKSPMTYPMLWAQTLPQPRCPACSAGFSSTVVPPCCMVPRRPCRPHRRHAHGGVCPPHVPPATTVPRRPCGHQRHRGPPTKCDAPQTLRASSASHSWGRVSPTRLLHNQGAPHPLQASTAPWLHALRGVRFPHSRAAAPHLAGQVRARHAPLLR